MKINIEDYIVGEKFRTLADNVKIFYRDTHDVNNFFKNCDKNNQFILISHNSDGCVTINPRNRNMTLPEHHANLNLMPDNCIKWFAQNVEDSNERVESIPIGLENSMWFVDINKKEKIFNITNNQKDFRNLVYLNLNTYNGILKERVDIYNMCDGLNYITKERGRNGIGFDHYLDNLYNHKFMICPEGNGIDVHQPWECIYSNTIPIQKKNKNNENWRDLPVCWVDDWNQICDENFLNSEYERITYSKIDKSKSTFKHWEEKIIKYK